MTEAVDEDDTNMVRYGQVSQVKQAEQHVDNATSR